MADKPDITDAEAAKQLTEYWEARLVEFEHHIYPVFYKHGYSKNTALLAAMMDELDDAVMVAISRRTDNG